MGDCSVRVRLPNRLGDFQVRLLSLSETAELEWETAEIEREIAEWETAESEWETAESD